MLKLSEYLGKYINDKGETVYYYRPSLGEGIGPEPFTQINEDPEILKVEILEIPGTLSYMNYTFPTTFPNLKKLILYPSLVSDYEVLLFDDAVFHDCRNLKEVHLYRPMCFVNKRGDLHWKKPFSDSKDATFYYHTGILGFSVAESLGEINRWKIPYQIVEDSSLDVEFPSVPYM